MLALVENYDIDMRCFHVDIIVFYKYEHETLHEIKSEAANNELALRLLI